MLLSARQPLRRAPWVARSASMQLRRGSSKSGTGDSLAKKLHDTGLYTHGRWAVKGKKRPKGDKNRVHIVSEKLCDDILTYTPSLKRHVGCDIIDIYPGVGLWSSKLHQLLKPRSHILLEPDVEMYEPFLQPLLKKKGTLLVPKSGIIWRDLSSVLDPTHLPHQVERPPDDPNPPQRNDTLLVTANLAFHPKRRFGAFDSLAQLVIYQFITSIRASSLFNKYGLVRMLLWTEGSDRNSLLAKSCQRRRRLAVDAELATEYIAELAGPDDYSMWFVRDHGLDLERTRRVLKRMAANKVKVPKGRENKNVLQVLASGKRGGQQLGPAVYKRPWREELERLEVEFKGEMFTEESLEFKRLKQLRYRGTRETKVSQAMHGMLDECTKLVAAHVPGKALSQDQRKREEQWNSGIDALADSLRKEFVLQRDNYRLFSQDPPVLAWDRREREPLLIQEDEFFPNTSCALLDIQPKAMHPAFCAMGPKSNRSGDMFELILRGMLSMGSEPVSKAIEAVWPGAADGVLGNCPSLHDPQKGGSAVGGYGEVSARTLNEYQWQEVLDAWMKWPFRPTLSQLVARISDDGETDEELNPLD